MKKAGPPSESRNDHGFTLIEVMVVLVVVGLLVTLVGLNLGGGGERRELEEVSRSLYLKMQTAAEEAVITNREVGLRLREGHYRFLVWQPEEENWVSMPGRGFGTTRLPEWVEYSVETDTGGGRELGDDDDDEDELPDLVFFSSGESTPFDLYLWWDQDRDAPHLIQSDGIEPPQWIKPGDNGASGGRR